MAIIKTYTLPSGATVYIADDCMAAPGSEDERRAIEVRNRAVYDILCAYAQKEENNGTHDGKD